MSRIFIARVSSLPFIKAISISHLCINFLNSSKLTLSSPSSSASFIRFLISSILIFSPIRSSTSLRPSAVMPFSWRQSNILNDYSISFSLVMVSIILVYKIGLYLAMRAMN